MSKALAQQLYISALQGIARANAPVTALQPSVLSLGQVTADSATLSWSAVDKADSYKLLKSLNSNMSGSTEVYSGTQLNAIATGLNDETQYYFQVVASSATLTSSVSNIVNATTLEGNFVDVILMNSGSQSNLQGNAEAREAQYSPILDFAPDIYAKYPNAQIFNVFNKNFEDLQVGGNTRNDRFGYPQGATYEVLENGSWSGPMYSGDFVGPEYGLANFTKNTGRKLYIIKYAIGGTSISQWQKGGDFYADGLSVKNDAFAKIAAMGKTPRVLCFYRNQGENDAQMSPATYATLLRQFYADLLADGIINADTKIIEHGTPSPLNQQNATKQVFVGEDIAHRFYIGTSNVTFEHDEIHYDLASQYYIGYKVIPQIAYGITVDLPASITPAAPVISYDQSTDRVTVTPPSPGVWRQMEYYYSINGGPNVRMTNNFTFRLSGLYAPPNSVTAQPGGVKVWSRAVAGRNMSPVATNTVTWN